MHKRVFLTTLFIFMMITLNAIFIEVGTGDELISTVPAYGYYDNGWSRTIYLQTDLTYEMEITIVSYNISNSPLNYTMLNQSFYMKHTTDSAIESTNYINPAIDDSYELVYSGDVTYNGSGWLDLFLDTPFAYNGSDNLEILVINNDGSYANNFPQFIATPVTPARAVYNYHDGYLPVTPGSLADKYPNTRFYFTAEGEPEVATLTAPENHSSNLQLPVDLTWTNGLDTDWVKLYLSTDLSEVSSMAETALLADEYTSESYSVADLNYLATYYWKVVSGNNESEYEVSTPIWSFTVGASESSIIIGNGQETHTHLPMEPLSAYSLSQTIYNQEWIDVDNQRIESISYFYSGNSAWLEENIQVYLGHTDLDEFVTNNSWVPISELVLVYDGPFTVNAGEGWVTIPLTIPFNYNNEDNLVVAFEANTMGYYGSADDIFGTSTTFANSIYHNANSVNHDFVTPPTGTTQNFIANILLSMGEIPATPHLMVTPSEYTWPETIINIPGQEVTFSMRNTGLDALTINSVSLDQNLDFILADNNSYPLVITDEVAQFTVTFHPLSVGEFQANITINDSENGDTLVPLTGTSADIMITEFPYFEDFENYDYIELPQDWSLFVDSQYTFNSVAVALTGFESSKGLRLRNVQDAGLETIAITPPISDLNTRRIRFMAKASDAGAGLIIGTSPNNSGLLNFTAIDTIFFSTYFEQYQQGFNVAPEGDNFIALKMIGPSLVYYSVYLDNLYIESIPEEPAIATNHDNLDFGDIYLNRTGEGYLEIENWGGAPLEVEFAQTGFEYSFTPSELLIEPDGGQNVIVSFAPTAEGEYTGSFELLSNDPTTPSLSITSSAFILPPLEDNITVIGNGELTNQSLPIEPYHLKSLTQSIYYPGEIGVSNQTIEKISWHYNGYSNWGPEELTIYMGLTNKSEFVGDTDWISSDFMLEVYNGEINVSEVDSWLEFELDTPFIYDNTQNLVVGVLYSSQEHHSSSDEFYCTASEFTRSIVYYGDGIVPNPVLPPTAYYIRNSFPNIKLEYGEISSTPCLEVYPTETVFDLIEVNTTSSEKIIAIRSVGLQNIILTSAPTISGVNADEFAITTDENTYPLILPLNQMAEFGVSFTPTSEGSKNATVEITDNASREVHQVTLRAYAYAEYEDGNDTPQTATILNLPVESTVYSIIPTEDVDWYKLPELGQSDRLLASVENVGTTSVFPYAWLYGPVSDPNNINPSSYLTFTTNIDFVIPEDGVYYLKVARYNMSLNGINPLHNRKRNDGEEARSTRDYTGLYTLTVDAEYHYDYNTPLNLEATNQAGFVELTWEEPPYERYLVGYNIFRNGDILTDMISIGTNTYHDELVQVGTEYNYYIVGVYLEPNGFSLPSATVSIVYYNVGEALWSDNFEDYPDFTLDLPNWIQLDLDGGETYSIDDAEYENMGNAMSFMVFNPASTNPPILDMQAISGEKILTCFSSWEGQNDDWMITPRVNLGTTSSVSFWAKSYTGDYGLERLRIMMSMGGADTSDFTFSMHEGLDYIEVPAEWTFFHYDMSALAGVTVRFALQCVSSDALALMIDDFRIDSTDDGVNNESLEYIPQVNLLSQNYPNPFNPETSISFSIKDDGLVWLDIYNIKGQKVKTLLNEFRSAGNHTLIWNGRDDDNRQVSSGVYLYKIRNGKFSSTKKMILMK